ncbi:MAG TPA: hypothetical protein VF188_09685, partial [Longimicrobiales bacterium]
MYWNIQDFGALRRDYKSDYGPLIGVIAEVVHRAGADVLFIQELKKDAINRDVLKALMRELCALPEPHNNWYYDWIKGSVCAYEPEEEEEEEVEVERPKYATSAELDWDAAHREGYAVFWNQNIAKFRVTPAPPVAEPGGGVAVANTQSETVRTRALFRFGGAEVVSYGLAVPEGGIVTPHDQAYELPAGTTAPGIELGAPANVNSGTVLPRGTRIGEGGVKLTAQTYNRKPVVIPGGYTLTEPLTLPAPGTVLVPEHALSLVLEGRDTRGGGEQPATILRTFDATPFIPRGNNALQDPNQWQYLYFTRGTRDGAYMVGTRRPAYITIDVNINGAPRPAQRLIPLIVYHAPAQGAASTVGMERAAYSRPLYQAFDHDTGRWIDNDRAVLGGDMNVGLDTTAFPYDAFTQPFGAGGANCAIRVYRPPPPRHNNPLNKTTARLRDCNGEITVAGTDNYRHLAIDNVFYRGFTEEQAPAPAPAEVYDLLAAVSGAAGVAYNL